MTSELVAAINQIAAERGIDKEEVFKALESAILSAVKKEKYGRIDKEYVEEEIDEKLGANLFAEVDRETGEFKLFASKTVVKKVKDVETEIALSEAELISPNVEIGDSVQIEMPSDDLGRIATQTAKQVLLQKIRESEKDAVISEFSDKVGEVYTALMQRMQKGVAVMEIGKATAFMPQEEQISNEFYRVGERYKVLLKSIEDSQILVSRADPKFLIELFKLEVPEIESGVVEIKAVAREAGSRSKIAVVSHQEGIDPIGSCVGQRGIRIANVMNELGEEKIDIIEWDEDLERFVANALSPAKVDSVKISGDTATVECPSDQLSLAIGRDGQNVRLAWKLTEIKIDIVGVGGEEVEKKEDAVEEYAEKTEEEVIEQTSKE
ncbi:transcription termination/antitermination protein NusA [Candidatus Dojkabacteria bacterium HGW-Dojkabacteria-1]|uniref:Transcription termination/antitermination protein NusA n=1 Tax=Candidatus Dojkabacteria bacterium HGW-Dojkabacteria-1 TaxID=2013761 RepID=A0A2N2F4G5_9BACT|nr:MAG: transcription termination/antitermination protein NusA [Candidatus Dojkabacteria bacterium HGW-Dojkabacteria-1]